MTAAASPRLNRRLAIALAVAGVAVAGVALVVTATDIPPASIRPDDASATIVAVLPGSFEWEDGIRVGQAVVTVERSDDPESWTI